jgi:MYXO-CTERM domain-containing protein
MTRWIVPIILVCATAGAARAATFPGDAAFIPLRCGSDVMTDPLADDPAALADRDLVGDHDAPAGLRAADAQFLYLRIRVDQDPAPAGAPKPSAWGMAFDLDGDRATYELLITADGLAGAGGVSVFTNHTTALANDPADRADAPAAASFTFANAARSAGAGTTFGGNPDFFVDIAVPWTTLIPLGLDRDTPVHVWVGSSSVANALDGDIACHDRGGAGKAVLDATASTQTTGDPTSAGAGGIGEPRLEGGGGCQSGGSRTLGSGLALAWLGLLGVRRRRRPRRGAA